MNFLKKSLLAVALVSLPSVAFAQYSGGDGYGGYGGYGGWGGYGGYGADEYGHVSSGQPQDCLARAVPKCKVDGGYIFLPRM
jgi:hypothetical protein